jgi:hypothetical protein
MRYRSPFKRPAWLMCSCLFGLLAVSLAENADDVGVEAATVNQQVFDRAREFLNNDRQPEAELLLTREVAGNPYSVEAWKMLGDLYLRQAGDYATRGQLAEAGGSLEKARRAFGKVQEISIDPEATGPSVDPAIVASTQKRLAEVETRFKVEVKTASQKQITESLEWAAKADNWFLKNDRDSVVQGLRALRKVHEFRGWLDTDTIGMTADAMRKLKALVKEAEWEGLCASAGFDVSPQTESNSLPESMQ